MTNNWEIRKFGDLIIENPKSTIKVRDALSDGKYIFFRSGEKTKFANESLCSGENIFLATGGKAMVKFFSGDASYSTDTYSVKANEGIAITKFVFYLLLANIDLIEEKMFRGAAIKHLQKNDLKAMKNPLPPLFEQKKIVKFLDEAFEKIEKAQENTEKNLRNSKELFSSYLQGVFVNPGKDWEKKILNDIATKITDGAHKSPKKLFAERTKHKFLYITSKNIRNSGIDLSNLQYVDNEFHSSIYSSCKPELDDILLTKDGANTGNVTLNTIDEPYSLLSSVALIKPNRDYLYPAFLKYYIQSPVGFKSITGKMTGAAIKRIILKAIKSTEIYIPQISVQKSIVKKFDRLLIETEKLEKIYEQRLADFEELKVVILRTALTNKL